MMTFCDIIEIIDTDITAVLVNCKVKDGSITVAADIAGTDAGSIAGGILHYDSTDELRIIEMDTQTAQKGDKVRVTMTLEAASEDGFVPLRWTAKVGIMSGGELKFAPVVCRSKKLRRWLDFRYLHVDMGGGNELFPYISKAGRLKLSYREASEYDGESTRIRELAALGIYKLLGPMYRRRGIYVIFEKFSRTAQDNSYYFFRYCMEELPESERKKFYYIIDKRSPDFQYVSKYGRNVVQFMSLRHMVYSLAARMVVSTDTVQHLYAWKSKQNPVKARIMKKPELFLQHGVTMLKNVSDSFGVSGAFPMKYFVTTSQAEQDIAVEHMGYTRETAPILGFTRWDALQDLSTDEDRTILIMPTWRIWLENTEDEEFVKSDYCQNYMQLFTSPRFREILEQNDMQAVLYLHPKFADRAGAFTRAGMGDQADDSRIRIVPFGTARLNDLMMRSSILITDYSSVCWDFLYMNKPVLFFQFDYDMYMEQHGSYLDMQNDLPGPRAVTADALADELEKCVSSSCSLYGGYEEKASKYFMYRDTNNSKRTYEFLISHS